jgi:hypothetical protein
VSLVTRRLTPTLGGYVVMILLGVFVPRVAVVGYLLIAIALIAPTPHTFRRDRLRRDRVRT